VGELRRLLQVVATELGVVCILGGKTHSPSKNPTLSAYMSFKRIMPKLSFSSIATGIHLSTDSKAVEKVVEHAMDEIDADIKRKKVLLVSHYI
jgi:hypothetical protein